MMNYNIYDKIQGMSSNFKIHKITTLISIFWIFFFKIQPQFNENKKVVDLDSRPPQKVCLGSCSFRRQSRSNIVLLDCLLTEQDPRQTL